MSKIDGLILSFRWCRKLLRRPVAFCDYAIQQDKVFLVADASEDPASAKTPWLQANLLSASTPVYPCASPAVSR